MERLKVIVAEVTQQNNVLKNIIDEGVSVPADDIPQSSNSSEVIGALGTWLREAADGPFKLDETGLRVTGRTSPGTRVMSGTLFGDLKSFTDQCKRIQKTKNARER